VSGPAGGLTVYREVLGASVVFEGLAPEDLDVVLARCRLVEVRTGEAILAEGQPVDGLYVILGGRIEFFLPEEGAGGRRRSTRVRLNVLGPGRCFGEYGLIDDEPGSASAVALAPARLAFLSREDFRGLTEQSDRLGKTIYRNLLRFLVGRLRAKDRELDVFLLSEGR
jgi:CRP-like cAMP-binding protein